MRGGAEALSSSTLKLIVYRMPKPPAFVLWAGEYQSLYGYGSAGRPPSKNNWGLGDRRACGPR